MIRLGVNIDHVATLRQARRGAEPDPVAAAVLALLGGADGITLHLREDRRHIQERDLRLLRPLVSNRLNLEMAAVNAIADLACEVKPNECTVVPERREELTTEGGLDVVAHEEAVARVVRRLKACDIHVSLFIDPNAVQIHAARMLGRRRWRSRRPAMRRPKRRPPARKSWPCSRRRRSRARPGVARPHGPRAELHQRAGRGGDPGSGGTEHRP